MATLVDVHYVSGPNTEGRLPACQSCGHAIMCLCTVRLDNDHEMVVGTDCATSLLGKDSDLQRHARQAAREWTKKTPAAREGEQRADYINRRIGEKLAARKAWDHWQRTCGGHWSEVVRRRVAERGVRDPYNWYPRRACWCRDERPERCEECRRFGEARAQHAAEKAAYNAAFDDDYEALVAGVEQEFGANRHDFLNKPAWRVRG